METVGQDARRTILTALRRRGALTTDALMTETGLSKTATRARLLGLMREGMIARVEPEHSGVGRPPIAYELTERGAGIFPVRDAHLLARLLAFLESEGERELSERFFETIWDHRREKLAESLGESASIDERVAALKALLEESDFMPKLELTSSGGKRRLRVEECNCPLPHAVRSTKIPCRLEARFLADAVGGRMAGMKTAEARRDTCVFEIDLD